jgi:transposase
MKTKLDIASLEDSIDFQAVMEKLDTLSTSRSSQRQKSVHDLLDRIKPALLRARQSNVPLPTLTAFLRENGISVSEATLRRYFHAQGIRHKTRQRKVAPLPEQPHVNLPSKTKLPPRLARRITQ